MRFIMFLLTVLIIYSSWHYYFYIKALNSFIFKNQYLYIIKIMLYFFIFSPFFLRFIEHFGYLKIAKIIAYPINLWMAFIFLFFALGLTFDAFKFIKITISSKQLFIFPLVISILIIIYGLYEANQFQLKRISLKTNKKIYNNLPLKIIQISDVHLGLMVNEMKLNKIVNIIKNETPDILVCTGDLVDGDFIDESILKNTLLSIKTTYGKFAITGNHEYYAGISKSIKFIKESGFTLLMNESIKIPGIINIIGVNDPTHYRQKGNHDKEINISSYDENLFTLFLKHQPDFNYFGKKSVDLELSGHTHKGQIFPFNLITYLFHPIKCGKLIYKKDRYVYVSNGTGTWGPPVRFLAKPEITLFEITN